MAKSLILNDNPIPGPSKMAKTVKAIETEVHEEPLIPKQPNVLCIAFDSQDSTNGLQSQMYVDQYNSHENQICNQEIKGTVNLLTERRTNDFVYGEESAVLNIIAEQSRHIMEMNTFLIQQLRK